MCRRKAQFAGSWYPADSHELRSWMGEDDGRAVLGKDFAGSLVGLVAPHAGYVYSGSCARSAYAGLGGWKPARVVILAPSHQDPFAGICCWSPAGNRPEAGCWESPLGTLPLDLPFIEKLESEWPQLRYGELGHTHEHSLELQLPFLSHHFGEVPIVPIAIGQVKDAALDTFAAAIAASLDERPTLLVASSDLSHFHSELKARELDRHFREALECADPGALRAMLDGGFAEACGAKPVLAMLQVLTADLGDIEVTVTDQCTSADISGDSSRVVGYLAAIVRERCHD